MSQMPPWLTGVLAQLKHQDGANTAPVVLSGPDPSALLAVTDQLVADLLCEVPVQSRACGQCSGCSMRLSQNHPDISFVFPQTVAIEKGLPVEVKSGRKPSELIRIEDIRHMQGFFNTASSRGAERFAIIYPFEALNTASANALLKSLEEPPKGLRFILVGHKHELLLPTIRSRCQHVIAPNPSFAERVRWLEEQGVDQADVVLSLAMLDPFEAKELDANHKETLDLRKKWMLWLASPEQHHHLPAGLEKNSLPVLFELALRLCFDLQKLALGVEPEQFPWLKPRLMWAKSLEVSCVTDLYATLEQEGRFAHHPLNPRLTLEFIAQKWQILTR